MAPSAIDIRKPEEVAPSTGQYKEQSAGPNSYSKKVEEEGTEDQPKATVECLAACARILNTC
jgi:hypothetical protein